MVGNVIVKWELLLTSILQFLCPHKYMKFIHGGHFQFSKTLKKARAHLHIVGNVIKKFD